MTEFSIDVLRLGGTVDKLVVPLSAAGGGLVFILLVVIIIVIFVLRRRWV